MKKLLLVSLVVVGLGLGACAQFAASMTHLAASVAGPMPHGARTLAAAQQAAILATKAADAAVNTGKLPRAVLLEINTLSDSLHAAVSDLERAQAEGKSLNFEAFNAALDAYNVYMTAHPAH